MNEEYLLLNYGFILKMEKLLLIPRDILKLDWMEIQLV